MIITKKTKAMKIINIILIMSFFFSFSQEKKVVTVSFNVETAMLEIDSENTSYKILDYFKPDEKISLVLKNYTSIKSNDENKYILKKVIRVRPANENFFKENYILEYWHNNKGESVVIFQKVDNKLRFKK